MAKLQLHYDFETDDLFPEYKLILHFRNFRNEYLTEAFKQSLKKMIVNKDPSKFLEETNILLIEDKYFSTVNTFAAKDFKKVKDQLQKKHDIMFSSWNIKKCVFYRNAKDSKEWILSVEYKGTYED